MGFFFATIIVKVNAHKTKSIIITTKKILSITIKWYGGAAGAFHIYIKHNCKRFPSDKFV